ncbi:ABC transporter ATP-binding protein [Pseudorhodoplanes sinuspersici]|uniref:ABC transporter ATP-binding protein n=1 Tax=Pseudorhodoplanes sinuspersici TaxID=1235591 RepID=A0A1W6ZZ89_9HYPH|nr:ABC transporter ATP-binding protein [Pseudorhodoplanes sinuspersici]ARQ02065.1 ABC transporter ATP-binding protein [Pseudorhodoplanes sinuspersici]RKE73860.1 amino acid/amide ABC transporter ATP-binding protein 2 (HAAT family) [Pseudorhodoplanes sinuspersici]
MLDIRNLHTNYGSSHIIQGIDVSVRDGEVFGIFGRNGVGKTTLLKAIAGWVKPTQGEIEFAGTRIDGLRSDRIARLGVGLVPEDRRIFPGLSVEENLTLGFLQVPGRSRADGQAALDNIYKRFPRLAERRRQNGTTLSGGEQQMLAMARVMIGKPRLLLIDEPSEGLAPMIVADLFAIIREMKAAGCTILLVEQNVHQALSVCDRFIAIERGRVMLSGDAKNKGDCERLVEGIAV